MHVWEIEDEVPLNFLGSPFKGTALITLKAVIDGPPGDWEFEYFTIAGEVIFSFDARWNAAESLFNNYADRIEEDMIQRGNFIGIQCPDTGAVTYSEPPDA